ncbi:MAG: transcriptional regulator PpsR [Pseudomonadota bacterium]
MMRSPDTPHAEPGTHPRRPATSTFKAPKRLFGDIDAKSAVAAMMAAADIALVLDRGGKIRDVAFNDASFESEGVRNWVGQSWRETVARESHPKIDALLEHAASKDLGRARHVNHITPSGKELPVQYAMLQLGSKGNFVAIGRDLRSLAAMQQQVVEAQQSIARDYARMRQLETRYRLLFRLANEAVIIIDPDNGKVVDANPATSELFGQPVARVAGKRLSSWFSRVETRALNEMIGEVARTGETRMRDARLNGSRIPLSVTGSLVQSEDGAQVMLAMTRDNELDNGSGQPRVHLLSLFEQLPDGFVVTEADGRILTANPAFLDLAQLSSEDDARGDNLENYIGRSGVEFGVLLNNLRDRGTVRHFATVLNGALGSSEAVDISCAQLDNADKALFGFTMRPVGGRALSAPTTNTPLPRSLDSMSELIGRVPMKDLVREAKDMIERLCIEAALELTDHNKASAAEVLGLSRQGLYAKMRQYDIGDLERG